MNMIRALPPSGNSGAVKTVEAWMWFGPSPLHLVGFGPSCEVYLCGKFCGDETGAIFAAMVEGSPFAEAEGHFYFPARWLAVNYPLLAAEIDSLADRAISAFLEEVGGIHES